MLESYVEGELVRRVRNLGGITVKLAPVSRAGLPDRLVVFPGGRIFLVEMKAPEGRLSEIQKIWHARAARLGIPVVVLFSPGQVKGWIREVFAEYDPPDRAIPGPKPKCPTCKRPTR